MNKMEPLTTKQIYILDTLKKLIADKGYPPTVRELGKAANLSSPSTIHTHLMQLEKKGYIRKNDNKNRTLEILVPNEYLRSPSLDGGRVFLVGEVEDGNLLKSYDVSEVIFFFSKEFVNCSHSLSAIRVNTRRKIYQDISFGDILILEEKEDYREDEVLVSVNESEIITIEKGKMLGHKVLGSLLGTYHFF